MANQQHLDWLIREGVEAWNARREEDDFIPDLSEANLTFENLTGANLEDAKLVKSDLGGTNLTRANLVMADIASANMTNVNLTKASLIEADLTEANLTNANMTGVNVGGTDLIDANLTRTQFRKIDLGLARTIDQKHIENQRVITHVKRINPLTQDQIGVAFGDGSVILPDHLHRPHHWPKEILNDEDYAQAYEEWLKNKEGNSNAESLADIAPASTVLTPQQIQTYVNGNKQVIVIVIDESLSTINALLQQNKLLDDNAANDAFYVILNKLKNEYQNLPDLDDITEKDAEKIKSLAQEYREEIDIFLRKYKSPVVAGLFIAAFAGLFTLAGASGNLGALWGIASFGGKQAIDSLKSLIKKPDK